MLVPIALVRFLMDGSRPILVEELNRRVGACGRATVLSLRGIINAATIGPTELVSGLVADRFPLRHLFLGASTGMAATFLLLARLWRRHPERIAAETPPEPVASTAR